MALYNLMADEAIVHTWTQETLGSYKVRKQGQRGLKACPSGGHVLE